MIKYIDHTIKRKGRYIEVDGIRAEVSRNDDYLYEVDRAGISAKGGARGLYKLLKECIRKGNANMWVESILNGVLAHGE